VETGRLLRLASSGYGFIQPEGGGPDLFMHVSDLVTPSDQYKLEPGITWLSYGRGDSARGPKAVRISIVPVPEDEAPGESGEPASPTLKAWAALWAEASEAAFGALMEKARANGWVQE
jgi:cold shock protein